MDQKSRGAAFLVLSSFFFALMSVFVSLAGDVPFYQKALFRNLVPALAAGAALWRAGIPVRVPKESRLPLTLRCISGLISVYCNYYGISHLPLANANSLNKLGPFFAILFAAAFLHERISRPQLYCVLLALTGSMFLIVPSMETLGFASVVALAGGIASGAAHAALRATQAGKGIEGSVIVFVFSASSTVVTMIPCLIGWTPMTAQQFICLLLAGGSCTAAQYSLTWAYRCASPKDISIYDSTQIIFSAVMGFVIFGQIPIVTSFIAYTLIILASALLFMHNKREQAA